MFKKILIAMMAVMVIAVPVGASAFSDDYVYTGSLDSVFKLYTTQKVSVSNLPTLSSANKSFISYDSSDGRTVLVQFPSSSSVIDFTKPQYGTRYSLAKNDKGKLYWHKVQSHNISSNLIESLTSSSNNILYSDFKAVLGNSVFFMSVLPPPPPKPVQLEAVKTLEEIVPQTVTVAGGIVLVASILLGLWLLIGLVKRLVFSFLR